MFTNQSRCLRISSLLFSLTLFLLVWNQSLCAQSATESKSLATNQETSSNVQNDALGAVADSSSFSHIGVQETPTLSFFQSLIALLVFLLLLFILRKARKPKTNSTMERGFQLLNLGENNQFIPLKEENQTLEFLNEVKTRQKLRLSANLNRVSLTSHQSTILLEDKNYKNALLINRRRSHRTVLWDNDVLDVGEMVLLYRNPAATAVNSECVVGTNAPSVTGEKPKGPVRKGTPVLSFTGNRHEIFLVRNSNTLGTSSTNDIVLEKEEVAPKHAKIVKIGEQWKIQNLQTQEVTLVNGRRIEQRFLHDGDEITTGNTVFKFKLSKGQSKQGKKY